MSLIYPTFCVLRYVYRNVLEKFFTDKTVKCILIPENLKMVEVMPTRLPKTKCLALLKTVEILTSNNVHHSVDSTELGGRNPFEQLELVSKSVLLPILSNPLNQQRWGEVTYREINESFHSFLSSTTILCAQVKGETRLPMPSVESVDGSMTPHNPIPLLESSILTWTKQIKNILKQDPEMLLKEGRNPCPDVEIAFWKRKSESLNAVFEQLQGSQIGKVLRALDQANSTYCSSFADLCKDVYIARLEANDNVKFLTALEDLLEKIMNNDDFVKLQELFRPILYTTLMIWQNSKYYNTLSRIVVLLKEICNAVIEQSCRYVSGDQIFSMIENEEANAAVDHIEIVSVVCNKFKSDYFEYKEKARDECLANPWKIQNNAIFSRLDSFLERCHDISDMIKTIIQFSKLAKIEIGSTKGKSLSESVHRIHSDFEHEVKTIKNVQYHLMDVERVEFENCYQDFRHSVKELERRLGSLICVGLDDCSTINGKFQLLDSFDNSLLERLIIKDELECKHINLLQAYSKDLKQVQDIFLAHRNNPSLNSNKNLPPIAGSLSWSRGLIRRVEVPMMKLRQLDKNILNREEAKDVIKIQGSLLALLNDYENIQTSEWSNSIQSCSEEKLNLNLLKRCEKSRFLVMNFDPALVCLLREVKYFLLLGINIPKDALQLYESTEKFRRWAGNLDLIVNMNNSVLKQLLPVERPLVAPYLAKFDAFVQKGIEKLNWCSNGVDEFIAISMEQVETVHGIMKTMKDNFSTIEMILKEWNKPMLERKSKPLEKDEFERMTKSFKTTRFAALKESSKQIHTLLKETNKILRVSNASRDWKSYVDYVGGYVIDGLSQAVMTSLEFLCQQIDPGSITAQGKLPLLEIKFNLNGKQRALEFVPAIGVTEDGKGLGSMIDEMIGSFLQQASLCKRVDGDGNYIREMHSDIYISNYMSAISVAIIATEKKCMDLKLTFEKDSFLWRLNLSDYFAGFCKESTIFTKNGSVLLDLVRFDAEIRKFHEIQAAVSKCPSPVDVDWLRIDVNPAKQEVSMFATKWINMFTGHILSTVLGTLAGFQAFMEDVGEGLEQEVIVDAENNKSLLAVMAVIRDVRWKKEYFTEIYEPQNQCVELLKKYAVDFVHEKIAGKNLQEYLEELPIVWEALVKKTLKKKEEILPMQMDSVDALKNDLDEFCLLIRSFQGDFRANAPFKFNGVISVAYKMMDEYAMQLDKLEAKIHKFHEFEDLFELQQSIYPEIGETRNEIKQLKSLWDFKGMINLIYFDWRTTPWDAVNTDDLEAQNKKLRKQLKERGNCFPAIKGWRVYRDIDEMMEVMSVALPLVNDLHSEAMRSRHWSSLARVCNVKLVDPSDNKKFKLNDMMTLNLHEHKAAIEEIVETVIKELKIEKKLKEIEQVWSKMEIDYAPHKDTEMFVPKPSEEVVEGIESHQMELQGIFGMGKFMEYFEDRVIHWQSLLRIVDDTLRMWMLVSKSWAGLESIFLASADIRSQLPEDTKRFEEIDSDFKELMKDAAGETNCVIVCSVEGRYEALVSMRKRLELCQKSLNEYLDIKKKIFPRFYFVSSVALLDMLANGTNPPKIMPYLGDCYDALANLSFIKAESGEVSSKTVDEMIAKDGERVPLSEPFTMEGEVESYLNNLTLSMQKSLKVILSEAIEKAASWEIETPRHEWLFNYPAQLCITGTQIYWTDETQLSLEEYEGGQEDAVKRYLQLCNSRLSALIQLVLGELTGEDRTKIISLITMDVHSRDVIDRLIQQKIEGPSAFAWQQQLRFEWEHSTKDVNVKICDFQCKYFYEWVGNTGRLVITPLTDRCYITLTMGLKLFLGGAPAGPAGTGKTETTKDLARALAIPCYVFNCSDQMNFESMADIFRGLAQTGAWGCFDEFNRIPIEVLSVVATQIKTIQDAIVKYSNPDNRDDKYKNLPAGTPPMKVGEFDFMGDTISLIPTCGFWITMNPGYAGRTELPENLKALFRSCAMIRPDMKLIQENMLMAEGFQTAKALSVKFNTLYELSSALLSKQPHYDWGLRAVKSVLRVAGGMKRANPDLDEAQVLMRALRDFNTPKIPNHDLPIFLRLINDLFMGLTVDSKVDETLKTKIIRVAKDEGLQHDEMFINKTCNFQELLDVRHSVMLLGPSGCAKSTIWKTLQAVHNLDKAKPVCVAETVNPKAVTGDELYGYMTLAKDWKDGVLSIIMRGMSKNFADQGFYDYQTHKWVVLDGDIDAVWIESMNTVMDDNKVLTLVSNERVPLSPAMRMVFEINSLKNATPATVSRAGILYINETDIGWRPFMETWVQKRSCATEKNFLPALFDRYVDGLAEMTRRGYKEVTSLRLINKVSTIIYLLEGMLPLVPEEKMTSEIIEMTFAYCAMWAFGGPMIVDKSGDYRTKFSEDFASTFGSKFPKDGLCFDYFFDPAKGEYVHWSSKVSPYSAAPIGNGQGQIPFTSMFVDTVETTRMSYLLDKLVMNSKYAMFVGNGGTGKTQIIKHYLDSLDKETDNVLSKNVVMSYYTSSFTLQQELEGYIDKRSGAYFGPPMGKKMVFFIDDINLPYVETYGTQNSIALLTQHMQYGSIFDRGDLGIRKNLMDIQYVAAMNPTAGSFEICERCQRHFATFAIAMPSASDLNTIFSSLFGGHLKSFQPALQELTGKIVDSAIQLHESVSTRFLPSAVKFMYNWNMRELTNIFQGCCLAKPDYYIKPVMLMRLFIHETQRVFSDRFISEEEIQMFNGMLMDVMKKNVSSIPTEELFEAPLVYTNFVSSTDGAYLPIPSLDRLKTVLDSKLNEYNENFAMMDLVLFEQAILHITRINRIIQNPGGNAMLIGVGGSGKQSLCRLAAFISDFEIKQLAVTSNFKVEDLKEELRSMYIASGVKDVQTVFLITDSQIVREEFLVYINGMLTTGWIPDLFPKEDLDTILGSISNDARAEGIADNPEARTNYFVSRVKRNLHLALAFSPVGDTFRIRARRFPGLVNGTVIDQFHPWPREALVSVAERFIADVELPGPDDIKTSLANHMAEEHLSVARMSQRYLETQRRYNYVTPKSFLELISFFKYLLSEKRSDVHRLIDRLDVGLSTLRKTSEDVTELQKDLKVTMEMVEEKKKATDNLINQMRMQQADAQVQDDAAKIEAEKANEESSKAMVIEKEAQQELSEAEPAMKAAAEAVHCLSKSMLTELKSLSSPPPGVDEVTNACLILIEKEYSVKKQTWSRARAMMQNVDAFKNKLSEFKGESITDKEVGLLKKYVEDANFCPEKMLSKSAAAANLCTWVVNIYGYNRIYVKVKPLMDSLNAARQRKEGALSSLAAAKIEVANVQAHLKSLRNTYNAAMAEKQEVEDQANKLMARADLAKRLVGGLASENIRWGKEIEKLRANALTLPGDCMLAAGFVSYVGAFDQDLREELWKVQWTNDLKSRNVPMTENSDLLYMLTDEGKNAKMITEGLPSDRISIENGSIVTNCKRWPLIIDPQAQGIKWLKQKEEGNVDIVQLSQKNWIKVIENAIVNGRCVIIENLGSDIDATLDPVLSRAIYKKGRTLYIKFGGVEIEYDPAFQLYLQTKLSNPHYKPEIAAQCTIINFIATEKGLEDQLLAKVVELERSDLEEKAKALTTAAVNYQMQLVQLEDDLLERLANAPDDILSDVPLIEGLEATKKTANEIVEAVEKGKVTQAEVEKAREAYRPQAVEGAMLYFTLTKLYAIDHMYQFSLDSFSAFFEKSVMRAVNMNDLKARVESLRESLRMTIFTWVSRGLFERHKLMFLAQLTFNLMKRGIVGDGEWNEEQFQFLTKVPSKTVDVNKLDWLPNSAWMAICALGEQDEFSKLPGDLIEAAPRFREWFNSISPENEKLPLDWAGLDRTPFQKMLVVRSLRPDRMTSALTDFIRQTLPNGSSYVNCDSRLNSLEILDQCLLDSTPITPIYFILSPGANVVADLDVMAAKYGFHKGVSYHNVSMGQGQDVVAISWLETAHRNGHWVILNNIHLMPKWLVELEKKLDEYAAEGSHSKFRVFFTSDPSDIIPIGILSRCIKITNEPPTGLKANLKRAWCFFSKDYIDDSDSKTRSILFGLCHFHSVMMERKMFGPMGFNMKYPFSIGDLRDSATCLQNYMDNTGGGKIPWQDLKYIFGEIMYGGHIVNDFDRLLANEYLNFFMKEELLDEMEMYPFAEDEKSSSFMSPAPTTFEKYIEHIETRMTQDTPIAFGLHPNAEIEYRTQQSNEVFNMLLELQPRGVSSSGEGISPQQLAEGVANDLLEKFSEKIFDVEDLVRNLDEQGPYQNVFIQEMDIMNVLLAEVKRSIEELQLGFAGELTMSDAMENLMTSLYMDRVPVTWSKLAWPSKRGLSSWVRNFLDRLNQLEEWSTSPSEIPKVTWLSGLMNPTSFLTAICQVTAQRNQWELDKLVTFTDITKRMNVDDLDSSSRDGAYIIGLSMQGARWDVTNVQIEKSQPKEMFCQMPIMNVKAVTKEKANVGGVYQCPVYMTEMRGPTWFFNAQLKTKSNPAKWTLAGVALIADIAV